MQIIPIVKSLKIDNKYSEANSFALSSCIKTNQVRLTNDNSFFQLFPSQTKCGRSRIKKINNTIGCF